MTEEQLNAIRERRAALPYAPWGAAERIDRYWVIGNKSVYLFFMEGFRMLASAQLTAVAAFTAAAPSDIDALLSENARLRAALEAYADEGNWRESSEEWGWEDWWMPTKQHGYDLAKKALEGSEE